jgi:hypothetical protein
MRHPCPMICRVVRNEKWGDKVTFWHSENAVQMIRQLCKKSVNAHF